MQNKQFGLCLIVIMGLLHLGPASAVSLDFQPANSIVSLNDSFDVDVVVSGLGSANEIVSAFDLDVVYDPLVLSATDFQFTTNLGSLDPFDFEVFFADSFITPGRIDFAELSVLSDAELDSRQGDSVVLGTMTFEAIAVGVSSLVFDASTFPGIDIKGREALRLLNLDVGDGSVTVNDVAVIPLPGAAIFMLTGLLGIGVASRKRKRVV